MKSRFGVAALMAQGPAAAKTKVIVARDATLQAESPTESRVLALLDKAILTATAEKESRAGRAPGRAAAFARARREAQRGIRLG